MAKRVTLASFAAILILAAALGFYFYTHPLILRIPSDPEAVDNITFYALGDQGDGGVQQWAVAGAMEKQAEKVGKVDFVALLGDNFYSKGTLTLDSPEWKSKFENVYAGKFLSATPFYAILGNHDPATVNGRNVEIAYAQQHLGSNRWRMPADHYTADFGKAGRRPLMRIVFLNTNVPLDALKQQADFIRQEFADTANGPVWRIVAGHHPVRTYGKHRGEGSEKAAIIAAALKDARVDLYLAGHDHNQQVIARGDDPVYIIAGGGGAHTYEIKKNAPDLLFANAGHGFVGLHADARRLSVAMFDTAPAVRASYAIDRTCTGGPSHCLKPVKK